MIEDGVALIRLSANPQGCDGPLEEFYVVVSEGNIIPARYKSYMEAFKICEALYYARTQARIGKN